MCKTADGYTQWLEFISSAELAKRYLNKCREIGAPTRTLFIMSSFDEEIWSAPLPKMKFLGFEVCEILFDACTIFDLFSYPQYEKYVRVLNENGLFADDKDATAFMNQYNDELAKGLVGDGDVDLYVCKVFEVDEESLLN